VQQKLKRVRFCLRRFEMVSLIWKMIRVALLLPEERKFVINNVPSDDEITEIIRQANNRYIKRWKERGFNTQDEVDDYNAHYMLRFSGKRYWYYD